LLRNVGLRHILRLGELHVPSSRALRFRHRRELRAVLSSRVFRQSRGLAKLLRYICSRALIEDAEPITEYTIAVDVLGKPQDFKETKDASVRVEVHRLRKRLAEFYEQEGAQQPIRIVIPTGHYAPRFLVHPNGESIEAPKAESSLQAEGPASHSDHALEATQPLLAPAVSRLETGHATVLPALSPLGVTVRARLESGLPAAHWRL